MRMNAQQNYVRVRGAVEDLDVKNCRLSKENEVQISRNTYKAFVWLICRRYKYSFMFPAVWLFSGFANVQALVWA